MSDLLPMIFIVLGALALVTTLFWLWQSLREAVVPGPNGDLLSGPLLVTSSERTKLLDEKQAVLLALKDLAAERDAGKLSEDDFTELNARYRSRAREVLQELDAQLAPHRARARELLAGAAVTPPVSPSAPPAATPAAEQAHNCPSCGVRNEPDAVFCKKCATRIEAEPSAKSAEPSA